MLGIIVHKSLAVTVGLLLAFAWRELCRQWRSLKNPYPFARGALASICALFFIVLPIVRPAFEFEALVRHCCRGGAAMPDGAFVHWIAAMFPPQVAPGFT
jgi:hypothetical protein